jgi:hypothetical protein
MWVRSLHWIDELSVNRIEFTSYPQQLFVSVWDYPEAFPVWGASPARFGPKWSDLVPNILRDRGRIVIVLPYWMPCLVGFSVPLAALRRRKRNRPGGFPVEGLPSQVAQQAAG